MLVRGGGLRPVGLGEGRRFALWELASLAELALGETVEPEGLTVGGERRVRKRLGSAGREYVHEEAWSRRYWLTERSAIVGTVAVDTWPSGWDCLRISSLYVHPGARRRGRALAALTGVYDAVRAAGLNGVRLETHWCWQEAVRYYLARGMWVAHWKHGLTLEWVAGRPRYEVVGSGEELVFRVWLDGQWVPLLVAGRSGGRLVLRQVEPPGRRGERAGGADLRFSAVATFALHLAVRGRPLVRGPEEWERAPESCDVGEPEGLAYRIRGFERVAREDGWRVVTPGPVVDPELAPPSWERRAGW